MSDHLAAELARHHVPPGTLVGLRLDHGWLAIVGALALSKRGCDDLLIDPRDTEARWRDSAAGARIRHVLAHTDEDGFTVGTVPALTRLGTVEAGLGT